MPEQSGARWRPWIACAVLFAVLVTRALLHEPWRDELQVWSVVRASASLPDLLERTRIGEQGMLWYFCVYGLDRIFGSFAAVQVAHAVLASAAVLLVVRCSPFSAFQKTAFAVGYFAFFEYAVVARPYVFALVGVCAACATWDWTGLRRAGFLAALAVLCLSSVYGVILGGALAAAYVFRRRPGAPPPKAPRLRRVLFAVVVLAIACGVYYRFSLLSENAQNRLLRPFDPSLAARTLSTLTDALLPVPVPRRTFWNSSLLRELDTYGPPAMRAVLRALPVGLGAVLFAAFAAGFARCRAALIVWVLGAGVTAVFTYAVLFGYIRHHGHVFLALVAASWIAALAPPEGGADRIRRRLFDVVLGGQAVAGLVAAAISAFVPFSPATACARWIRDRGLEDVPTVAHPDAHGSAVAGLLERPWYFPRGQRWGTHVRWDAARAKPVDEAEVLRAAESLRDERRSDVLVVTTVPLGAPHPSMELLATFPAGIVPDESYVVYRLPARR